MVKWYGQEEAGRWYAQVRGTYRTHRESLARVRICGALIGGGRSRVVSAKRARGLWAPQARADLACG